MKRKITNQILKAIVLYFCLVFAIKYSGPRMLNLYLKTGIGDCQKIPILCIVPEAEMLNPVISADYTQSLLKFKFSGMSISVPKEFKITKQEVTKSYYKKKKYKNSGSAIYLLYEPPEFFVTLFPQVKKEKINNNYEFMEQVMDSRLEEVRGLSDAFFVIMKSIFIPDLGDLSNAKIVKFTTGELRGFISYNFTTEVNYFSCDIIGKDDGFFKVYIKDKNKLLDLPKVISIISTVKPEKEVLP